MCGGVYHQQWIEWRESKRQKPKELMMSRELKQQATLTQWVWAMARPIVMGERISRGGNKLMKKQSKGRRYARLHMTCMIESLFCQRAAWISVPTSDDTFSLLLFFFGFIVHFFLDFFIPPLFIIIFLPSLFLYPLFSFDLFYQSAISGITSILQVWLWNIIWFISPRPKALAAARQLCVCCCNWVVAS